MHTSQESTYKVAAIDRLSLIIEKPGNRLNQCTLVILERPPHEEHFPKEEFCKLLRAKLLPTQLRFRCRVSADMSTFEEMDSSWDVSEHVKILRIQKRSEEKDDEDALMRCVSDLQNLELSRDKPLWDVFVIENYSRGTAMMWRVHHTIGDGFSQVTLFATLSELSKPEVIRNFRENYFGSTEAVPEQKSKNVILSTITKLLANVIFYAWVLTAAIKMVFKYAKSFILFTEAKTVFKNNMLSEKKTLCWIPYDQLIPVSECSKVGKKYKCTINDVMISSLLGGMARYMDKYQFSENERPDKVLHVGISILANMRDVRVLKNDSKEAFDLIYMLANKVGFMASHVPIYGIHDPVSRLKAVNKELTKVKNSGEQFVSYYASSLVWMLPTWAISYIWEFLLSGVTLVVSNVRGLTGLKLFGRKILSSYGFVPGTGNGQLAALVLSVSGYLNMCLNIDSTSVKDPKYLIECFLTEYQNLREQAGIAKE